jgi:hypothetical protein
LAQVSNCLAGEVVQGTFVAGQEVDIGFDLYNVMSKDAREDGIMNSLP